MRDRVLFCLAAKAQVKRYCWALTEKKRKERRNVTVKKTEKVKEGPSADAFHLERLLTICSQAAS